MGDDRDSAHHERKRRNRLFGRIGLLPLAMAILLIPVPARQERQDVGTDSEACASTDPSGTTPITGECRDFGVQVPSTSETGSQNLLEIIWEELVQK